MCSCIYDYNIACCRRRDAWVLYNTWYNRVTIPRCKTEFKLMFHEYPEILQGISDGRDIKILLYAKLRQTTRQRLYAWRKKQQHQRFNTLGDIFYAKTNVSMAFACRMISEYLG